MKKLFIFTVTALVMLGCGSSNGEKYSVTDDGNGTKSPRVKEVVRQFVDANNSVQDKLVFHYSYTKSLLKSIQVESNTYTYEYNNNNQVKSIVFGRGEGPRSVSTSTTFTYDPNTVWKSTKLPVITKEEVAIRGGNAVSGTYLTYVYNYAINVDSEATQLVSIYGEILMNGGLIHNIIDRQYTYNAQGLMVLRKEDLTNTYPPQSNQSPDNTITLTQYVYTKFNKISKKLVNNIPKILYFYNSDNVLEKVEHYRINDDGTSVLESIDTYKYENKQYYSDPNFHEIFGGDEDYIPIIN